MKIFRILIPLLIIGIASFIAPRFAAAEELVSAEISIDPGDFTVGDPLPLLLSVRHPAGSEVILPRIEEQWGDFLVRSQSPGSTVSNADGSETTTQLIDARLFSPGTYTTPAFDISISNSEGNLSQISVPPATIDVVSVLVEGDTELRDIKPQASLPYASYLPWLIGLSSLALAMGFVLFYIMRKRKLSKIGIVDNRLPHEVALDELDRVESLGLPDAGKFKEHYTLISDCIRLYMESTCNIPVMERTTHEIRSNLDRTTISPATAGQFIELLEESDLVKFSRFIPDTYSAYQLLGKGREIVDLTTPSTDILETGGEIEISPPPTHPDFGKYGSNRNAEVKL